MSDFWWVIGVCMLFVIGGALPLIRERKGGPTPLPPRKETLKDWREEARQIKDWGEEARKK